MSAYDPEQYQPGQWWLKELAAAREGALKEAAEIARCYDLGTPDGHAIADAIEARAAQPAPAPLNSESEQDAVLGAVKVRLENILERGPTEPTRKDALAAIAAIDAAMTATPSSQKGTADE